MNPDVLERRAKRLAEWLKFGIFLLVALLEIIIVNGIALYLIRDMVRSFHWAIAFLTLIAFFMALSVDLVTMQILLIMYPRS